MKGCENGGKGDEGMEMLATNGKVKSKESVERWQKAMEVRKEMGKTTRKEREGGTAKRCGKSARGRDRERKRRGGWW